MSKVVVITGASKGIGLETAKIFKKNNYIVYDLSRTGKDTEISSHIYCDVSDFNTVEKAIAEVIEKEGRIDVVISNAGFGISGSVEGHSYESIRSQIDVNFVGSSFLANATLGHLRKTKGRIIFMSSVAAVIPIPFQAIYSATKAAILSLAQCLDNELQGSGARSIALLPGDLSTSFTKNRIKNKIEPDFYKTRVENSVGKMEKDEINGMQPTVIANKLYKLATQKNPKVKSSVGILYKFALVLGMLLPVRLKQFIIKKMYA
ncbi:SDR family NAD(P)-dependent oxidoreductase [Helcococcus bovis]|uniref:SDR family NAD(P)-dependent oxidoreductase n=1 Tax=Helcococcus bovis TaxID=3153252 RepID=UPI0038BB1F14